LHPKLRNNNADSALTKTMRDVLCCDNKMDKKNAHARAHCRGLSDSSLSVINFLITRVAKLDIERAMNREEAA